MEVEGNTELMQVKPKRIINQMLGEVSGIGKNFEKNYGAHQRFYSSADYSGSSVIHC